jgi:uncharacterized protein YneF (UPF0154 family)
MHKFECRNLLVILSIIHANISGMCMGYYLLFYFNELTLDDPARFYEICLILVFVLSCVFLGLFFRAEIMQQKKEP